MLNRRSRKVMAFISAASSLSPSRLRGQRRLASGTTSTTPRHSARHSRLSAMAGATSNDSVSPAPAAPDATSPADGPADQPANGLVTISRALVSVSDKTSLITLCTYLHEKLNVEILSTGGSAAAISAAGIPVIEVADYTGVPEMLDGRVKTLNAKVHGGLLSIRDNPSHSAACEKFGIKPIDLLVVNLYPFVDKVRGGAEPDACIENIDIGGPAMIRAAAKNFPFVAVLTDVSQYSTLLDDLSDNHGATTLATRKALAAQAYASTAAYDAAVSSWFASQLGQPFPDTVVYAAKLKQKLRYGENPHQDAAFYQADTLSPNPIPSVASAEVIQGKELSFNNIADTDAAFNLVAEFADTPACAIIKHSNPCGVAVGVNAQDAYLRALSADPISAFGGIVAFNQTVTKEAALEIVKLFTEVVVAPDASGDALQVLSSKKNLRVLLTGSMPSVTPDASLMTLKSTTGGFLLQSVDQGMVTETDLEVVTKRAPTKSEIKDLLFAWKVSKHVKSNAIVYAKNGASVGTGAGQMSRVDSARIAAWKSDEASENAQEDAKRTIGSVVASDAFFPFADGLIAVADAGATAVIQPGGSKRDDDVIAAADERNLAMVMTSMRHFKH